MTAKDVDIIRRWINSEPEIFWIIRVANNGNTCNWRAVPEIEAVHEQEYALWHKVSGPLNIPSGRTGIADEIVDNPLLGWSQTLDYSGATKPWFGGNLPGPYNFSFAEAGKEAPGSLGRSGFSWLEDRYKSIGKPAHPATKAWWQKLKRFIIKNSLAIPWAETNPPNRIRAYIFPDAQIQIAQGRHRDINP